MFHFPAFPPTHYEFTRRRPDITLARFPHSDILGSTLACQLPEAYRRLQRPSSALHTKASTERPKTPTKQKKQTTHPHNTCRHAKMLASTIQFPNTTPTPQQTDSKHHLPAKSGTGTTPKSLTACRASPSQSHTPPQPHPTQARNYMEQGHSLERR